MAQHKDKLKNNDKESTPKTHNFDHEKKVRFPNIQHMSILVLKKINLHIIYQTCTNCIKIKNIDLIQHFT